MKDKIYVGIIQNDNVDLNCYSLPLYNEKNGLILPKYLIENIKDVNEFTSEFNNHKSQILNFDNNSKYIVNNNEFINYYLNKMSYPYIIKCKRLYAQGQTILYTKETDKFGNMYAKELLTGFTFPLCTEENINISYEIFKNKNDYYLKTIYEINNSMNSKSDYIVINTYSANKSTVDMYINYFVNGIFSNKHKKNFESKLKKFYEINSSNISKNSNHKLQYKKSVNEDNIEYLLYELKNIDIKSYEKFKLKYDLLLKSSYNKEEIKKEFWKLQSDIYYDLKQKYEENICELISQLKEKHFNFLKLKENINIKLFEVDELFEHLNKNSSLNLYEKRKAVINISYLYIFSIYENKNEIKINDLEGSTIKYLLKTIILCLNELYDNEEIENNKLFEFNNIDDSFILDFILIYIKEMKLKENKINVKKF